MPVARRVDRSSYWAPNTRRTHSTHWVRWAAWCGARGECPLPAAPHAVRAFLDEQAGEGLSIGTLDGRIFAIRNEHADAGYEDPTKHRSVKLLMASVRRRKFRAERQAKGLTFRDLERIRAAMDRDNHVDVLTYAMICLMRDAMLRRSECVAIEWRDIEEEEDGSGRLTIRRSKTDQWGVGAVKYLSGATMEAMRAAFGDMEGLQGPVFDVCDRTISNRIQRLCRKARLAGDYSGHSCRVGMAQDLTEAGASLHDVQIAGRWSNAAMPARYVRGQEAARSAVARFYEGMAQA